MYESRHRYDGFVLNPFLLPMARLELAVCKHVRVDYSKYIFYFAIASCKLHCIFAYLNNKYLQPTVFYIGHKVGQIIAVLHFK